MGFSKQAFAIAGFAMLLAVAGPSAAQKSAPIPEQIPAAKKVFLSNLGNECRIFKRLIHSKVAEEDHLYNIGYFALKDWGRFELVASPAKADLILEIVAVDEGFMAKFNEAEPRIALKLAVRDPSSQVVLWAFTERPPLAWPDSHSLTKFDEATQRLIDDLKDLIQRATAPAANTTH